MNFRFGPAKALSVAALSAFSSVCVVTHHPVFASVGLVLTFLALAGRGDELGASHDR